PRALRALARRPSIGAHGPSPRAAAVVPRAVAPCAVAPARWLPAGWLSARWLPRGELSGKLPRRHEGQHLPRARVAHAERRAERGDRRVAVRGARLEKDDRRDRERHLALRDLGEDGRALREVG